jgi:signal transduction histidine kinase
MFLAVAFVVLALVAALCGRLGARSIGPAARVRVLALLYGAAVVEALAVTGETPTELAMVLVAFAAGLSWRVPSRVQGWTADVGEAAALGSALLLLVVVVPERARTIALVAYAAWAIAGAVAGRREVQGRGRLALAILAIGPALAAVLLVAIPSASVLVASVAVAAAVAILDPPKLGELVPRLGAAVLGSAAAILVMAAVPVATPALLAAAVLGAVLVDAARAPRRRGAHERPRSLAAAAPAAELAPAVRRTLLVIERLTDPLAAQTQVVQALDDMFPDGHFILLRSPDAPQGLLSAVREIGEELMTEVRRAGVLLLDDVDALPAAAATEAERLAGTLLLPVACGEVVYGALLVRHDGARDDALIQTVRRFADLLGHKLETHRLYRELEQRQRLATIGTFSAALIHDLRNPLSVVRLNLQMIDRAGNVDRSDRASVEEAMGALERVIEGLGETLDFTRPLTLDVGRIDPAELARLVVDECRLLAREREVTLRLDEAGEVPIVRGDASRLRRVLDNLVRNALEVAPPDSEVVVSVRTLDAGVELSVCDRGKGIDPKLRDRIFEPFVSSKERGVGLGLAIASRVIELHRGRIVATPRDGGGTCMQVWLPV